jgi:hypothetical protein
MITKMRVAICFWGLCRATDQVIESIQKFIYKPLQDAGILYDVYVHALFLERPYTNTRNSEEGKIDQNLCYLLLPTQLIKENQDEIDDVLELSSYRTMGDPWQNKFDSLNNHIRALYSLQKVTQMALSKEYSAIVFSRPDVKYLRPLQIDWLTLEKDTVLLPDFHEFPINDRFAITTPKTAETYGKRFSMAKEYSLTKLLHSESYLNYCLHRDKCKIIKIPFRFRRFRVPCTEVDLNIH